MDLVIVESPTKAKTINKYLGNNYSVLSSNGHIRNLLPKNGSVDPNNNFSMLWHINESSKKNILAIEKAIKNADNLILATDPDREGEAISWHIVQRLKEKKLITDKLNIVRVAFNAITKKQVLKALDNPRDINNQMVDSYLARLAIDYLVGFNLSPLLWRKLPSAKSAGRVQSVALKIICNREKDIESFQKQDYWTVEGLFNTNNDEKIEASLKEINSIKLKKFDIKNEEEAKAIVNNIKDAECTVTTVESKIQSRNASPPFITSTMQQEASTKLGFPAIKTMKIAQSLYEGIAIGDSNLGLITYMRTDSVSVEKEAITQCREFIKNKFGEEFLPQNSNIYKTKSKLAQEAHEAIRPTDMYNEPSKINSYLNDDQKKLYNLIWRKMIASQMSQAKIETTSIGIEAVSKDNKKFLFRSSNSVVKFEGFLKLYNNDTKDNNNKKFYGIKKGEQLKPKEIKYAEHSTEPPPRYSEATLIKKMEEVGIGRPSTYTSILSVLKTREYVRITKNKIFAEDKGRIVNIFLINFFSKYVEYDFTAKLEDDLDKISNGELDWRSLLSDFWKEFDQNIKLVSDYKPQEILEKINEDMLDTLFKNKELKICPKCEDGELSLKTGRFGSFIGCSNYPTCRYSRKISSDNQNETDEKIITTDNTTGKDIILKEGRFGHYLQLGENTDDEKPKRVPLPKNISANNLDAELALKIISLPKIIANHPETGKEIIASLGKFGPYIKHDNSFVNVKTIEELLEIGGNRAVDLLAEKSNATGKKYGLIKELGDYPKKGKINLMTGRFGTYLKYSGKNYRLPKDSDVNQITLDKAIEVIKETNNKKKSKKKQ